MNATVPALDCKDVFDALPWQPVPKPEQSTDMPYATHSGVLDLFGHSLRCFRLNTGETVIDADDMNRFFEGAAA